MKTRSLLSALGLASILALGASSSSRAATANAQAAVSANWAGYVVTSGSSNTAAGFSSVSGSWVAPTADCSSGDGQSAFWVGLGGQGQQSTALEQIGTQANCSGGQTSNYAWYELVPSAPVRLDLAIRPGDHLSATVGVSGTSVTVSLSDHTTGASTTKTLQMSNPDVSSAEWIAEAPSACTSDLTNCQPLTLSNFGTVTFSGASATASDHTGTISDAQWTAQPMQLAAGGGPGFAAAGEPGSPGAAPSTLSTDGSSFSVSTQSAATSVSGSGYPGTSGAYGGGGYGGGYGGGGYGYGYGGGGSGDGYGGAGYGYGDAGYGYGGGGAYGYGPGGY